MAVPIVAFANADGGVIAIGVSNKTRKIEGIDQHTEKLNELLRVPFDFCNPSVPVTCSYLPCTDKDGNENRILLMEIPASSSLHTNQADEAFVRVRFHFSNPSVHVTCSYMPCTEKDGK